ncbi:MAG: hypothetical protein SFY66_02970 [Oculatellaceae cyanobacterium bins.114]|nr:hypothetical protein [Oculatellaceae cyanobacterium bins.114]
MTARERLIQEIEQVPDSLAEEVLNFLLFIKNRQQRSLIPNTEVQDLPGISILARMGGVPQHLLSVGNLSEQTQDE